MIRQLISRLCTALASLVGADTSRKSHFLALLDEASGILQHCPPKSLESAGSLAAHGALPQPRRRWEGSGMRITLRTPPDPQHPAAEIELCTTSGRYLLEFEGPHLTGFTSPGAEAPGYTASVKSSLLLRSALRALAN